MVVDRQHLHGPTVPMASRRPVEDQLHDLAALTGGEGEGADLLPAAGEREVVDARPVDALFDDELEDTRQLRSVQLLDREADADLHARVPTALQAGEGLLEGALLPADAVVDGGEAVEADVHVLEPGFPDLPRRRLVDQRPVRGEHRPYPPAARIPGEVEEVGAKEALAPEKITVGTPIPARSSRSASPSAVDSSSWKARVRALA